MDFEHQWNLLEEFLALAEVHFLFLLALQEIEGHEVILNHVLKQFLFTFTKKEHKWLLWIVFIDCRYIGSR